MKLLSVVALKQALPEHDLPAGAVGTVVEPLDASNVLVEFSGEDGVAGCILPVSVELLELQAAETPDTTSGSLVVRSESSSAHTVQLDYTLFPGPKIIVVTSRTLGGDDLISLDALIVLARALSERHQMIVWDVDTGERRQQRAEWRVQLSFAHQMLDVRFVKPLIGGLSVEISHRENAPQGKQFIVCLSREGLGEFSADDLTVGRLYEVISPADTQGMVRVVDDSGDAYLYPESLFDPVEVQEPTATRLHALLGT